MGEAFITSDAGRQCYFCFVLATSMHSVGERNYSFPVETKLPMPEIGLYIYTTAQSHMPIFTANV
jgi:hypothetical protein